MNKHQRFFSILFLSIWLITLQGCAIHRNGFMVKSAVVLLDGGSADIYLKDGDRDIFMRANNSIDKEPSDPILIISVNNEAISPASHEAEEIISKLYDWLLAPSRIELSGDEVDREAVVNLFQTICENPNGVAVSNDDCQKFRIGPVLLR